MKKNRIWVVCANGGHLTEMEIIVKGLKIENPFWVTFIGSDTIDKSGLLLVDYH